LAFLRMPRHGFPAFTPATGAVKLGALHGHSMSATAILAERFDAPYPELKGERSEDEA
jgi:hypothetical protein